MKYTSPFHLLPTRDTQVLTTNELKRWKKELMLQFDLNQSPVIDIDGKFYDKNDIIQAFDLLKDRPDFHLRLYQNKLLLNFIEQGSFDFFRNEKNWEDFWDTPYRDWLGQWFIPVYDKMVYGFVEDKSFEALEDLRALQFSKFRLPDSWGSEAHQKAYRHLSQFVERADVALETMPPVESPRIKLHKELREYVDLYYVSLMNLLPQEFEGLRRQYGNFAHNVIASIFHKERLFKDIERESLITLREAAQIDIKIRNSEYSKGLLPLIEQYLLEHRESTTKEKSNYWFWILFVVAIFALRVCRHVPSNDNPPDIVFNPPTSTILESPVSVKKSDILGVWGAKSHGTANLKVEKTLTFQNESSGVMNVKISEASGGSNTCEIIGEFTWTLVLGKIDVFYKNISVKEEFALHSEIGDELKNEVLNNFSESLTPNAMKIASTTTILSLEGKNITYRPTKLHIVKIAKDSAKIKFKAGTQGEGL